MKTGFYHATRRHIRAWQRGKLIRAYIPDSPFPCLTFSPCRPAREVTIQHQPAYILFTHPCAELFIYAADIPHLFPNPTSIKETS